jgi:hypothetical protein
LRCVFALTAIVQLFVLGAITATSADEAMNAAPHVDVTGTAKHVVHDESKCIACAVRHLTAIRARTVALPVATTARSEVRPAGPRHLALTQRRSPSAPRAPPTSL